MDAFTMPTPRRGEITFILSGPIASSDLAGLCRRVCAKLERTGAALALCDVQDVSADAVTVDALARLQLAAHRHACQVRLRRASDDLRELVAFMGLQDILPE